MFEFEQNVSNAPKVTVGFWNTPTTALPELVPAHTLFETEVIVYVAVDVASNEYVFPALPVIVTGVVPSVYVKSNGPTPVSVIVTGKVPEPVQVVPPPEIVAEGESNNVIIAVAEAAGQDPVAAMEFVTVYVPAVLAAKLISPVEELIDKPVVELNTPALAPVPKETTGLDPLKQRELVAYENSADGLSVKVIVALAVFGQDTFVL